MYNNGTNIIHVMSTNHVQQTDFFGEFEAPYGAKQENPEGHQRKSRNQLLHRLRLGEWKEAHRVYFCSFLKPLKSLGIPVASSVSQFFAMFFFCGILGHFEG